METTSLLLVVIMMIFGILQIILFFKVWGMTNNVKKIKDKIISPSISTSIIRREIKKKNPKIDNMLFDAMWDDLEFVWENRYKYDTNYPKHVEYWKELYEQAGVVFPEEVEKIKCNTDYEQYSLKRN